MGFLKNIFAHLYLPELNVIFCIIVFADIYCDTDVGLSVIIGVYFGWVTENMCDCRVLGAAATRIVVELGALLFLLMI